MLKEYTMSLIEYKNALFTYNRILSNQLDILAENGNINNLKNDIINTCKIISNANIQINELEKSIRILKIK